MTTEPIPTPVYPTEPIPLVLVPEEEVVDVVTLPESKRQYCHVHGSDKNRKIKTAMM